MHSKFLSVMLMALVFVVACAAVPVKVPTSVIYGRNSTSVSGRNSARVMNCKTEGNTKVCKNPDRDALVLSADFDDVNEHFSNDLPNWKSTDSYEFCFGGSCAAMTTLSGSQFIPSKYRHVADEAIYRLYQTQVCVSENDPLHPSAVDVYLYERNFVISWWFNYANFWPC
ncbi:hypothetical protein HPULCUR_006316 [Helicostylum pulchrum]|uniref:Uncharacterized protein n=1 Tax=Helicostylum pulchrum TaxID=562976 RepID=A0ABP9Y1K2_9FUNG